MHTILSYAGLLIAASGLVHAAAPVRSEETPADEIAVNTDQYELLLTAPEPVLFGKRELRIDACGNGSLDEATFFLYLEPGGFNYRVSRDGERFDVVVGLRSDAGDHEFRYRGVHAGVQSVSTIGAASTDEALAIQMHTPSGVELTLTPRSNRHCLRVWQTDRPYRKVVQQALTVSGARLDGLELIPEDAVGSIYFGGMEIHHLLNFIAFDSGLKVEKIDDTHFALHAEAAPEESAD